MPERPSQQGLDARTAAVNVLDATLRKGIALDEALSASHALAGLPSRDRAFARLMVTATLRRLGQIDAVLARFVQNPLPERAFAVRNILRLGVTQLLLLESPAHAVVDNAVRSCVVVRQQGFKGLVNAVLRRVAQDGKAVLTAADDPALNLPAWLWDGWQSTYGAETARAIAMAHLAEPPLDLSVRDDPAEWAARLGGDVLPGGTVRLSHAGDVTQLDGFADGAWWVQDCAAALPARVLMSAVDTPRDRKILDLCAAPGGKTLQLALAGAQVTAVDRSGARLARLRENLARMDVTANVVEADAAQWRPPEPADALLLDAPCSATGTIRRHPDIVWNKTSDDVERLAALQGRLLHAAVDMVRPGGALVYSVCSLQPEEGPARIAALLSARRDVKVLPVADAEIGGLNAAIAEDGTVRTLPSHMGESGGMDGFFIARLRRTA